MAVTGCLVYLVHLGHECLHVLGIVDGVKRRPVRLAMSLRLHKFFIRDIYITDWHLSTLIDTSTLGVWSLTSGTRLRFVACISFLEGTVSELRQRVE